MNWQIDHKAIRRGKNFVEEIFLKVFRERNIFKSENDEFWEMRYSRGFENYKRPFSHRSTRLVEDYRRVPKTLRKNCSQKTSTSSLQPLNRIVLKPPPTDTSSELQNSYASSKLWNFRTLQDQRHINVNDVCMNVSDHLLFKFPHPSVF